MEEKLVPLSPPMVENNPPELFPIDYKDIVEPSHTETGLRTLLSQILTHGYGEIENSPPDLESTKKAVTKISHAQNTIYGDFSEWTADLAHADTAYTSDHVNSHTDTSYFSEPMG